MQGPAENHTIPIYKDILFYDIQYVVQQTLLKQRLFTFSSSTRCVNHVALSKVGKASATQLLYTTGHSGCRPHMHHRGIDKQQASMVCTSCNFRANMKQQIEVPSWNMEQMQKDLHVKIDCNISAPDHNRTAKYCPSHHTMCAVWLAPSSVVFRRKISSLLQQRSKVRPDSGLQQLLKPWFPWAQLQQCVLDAPSSFQHEPSIEVMGVNEIEDGDSDKARAAL